MAAMDNDEATGTDEAEEREPDYQDWLDNEREADEAKDAYFSGVRW